MTVPWLPSNERHFVGWVKWSHTFPFLCRLHDNKDLRRTVGTLVRALMCKDPKYSHVFSSLQLRQIQLNSYVTAITSSFTPIDLHTRACNNFYNCCYIGTFNFTFLISYIVSDTATVNNALITTLRLWSSSGVPTKF